MHRPRVLRKDRLPLVAIVAGLVLIVVALVPWGGLFGDDGSPRTASTRPTIDTGLFESNEPLPDIKDGDDEDGSSKDGSGGPGGEGLEDPFANSSGSNSRHTVVLRLVSDGSMYVGYRYRDGKGGGRQVVSKSLKLTRTVRGTFPLAQVGVGVLSNATFAKCSISVDGVVVDSRTAFGGGQITVCTG